MNSRIAFLFPLLLCGCASNRTPVKSTQSEEIKGQADVLFVEEVAPVEIVAEERIHASTGTSSIEALKSIQYNPKYGIANNINDRFDFYWEKNASNKYNAQGVVDKDGNVILPHIFTRGSGPSNGYELVLSINNTNYGLYNLNEQSWTIPMMYHELSSLSNNVFSATKDNKWGVIDNNNNVVGPFIWKQIDRIYGIENYMLVSENETWGIYSIVERKLTVPDEYSSIRKLDRENYFIARKGAKYNVIDINNKPLFKEWYDEIRSASTNTDYFIVKLNNKYGVIDHTEKVIVPIAYLEFSESNYSDGSYLARNKEGKYGFMLIDGRITLPFNYDNVKRGYYNNVISIQSGKCGLVRVNSGMPTEIVTCEFDNITEGSKSFIVEKGGKFGLLNQYGKPITDIVYTILESLKDNYYEESVLYRAQKGKEFYLLNEQGLVINSDEFLDITPLYRRKEYSYSSPRFTYLKVKGKNGKVGVVDKLGKVIIAPQFDDINSEDDNFLVVKSKDKAGIYSLLDQKFMVECNYDLIIRSNNNYYGFIGKDIDMLTLKSGQFIKTPVTSK